MQAVDALGPRPERQAAFTGDLLAEAEDQELQAIVEAAARDLDTPIALVNMILDHIQFFKAHYGLPADLSASRGTPRDVSLCQYVVRDGKTFEVADLAGDTQLPQHFNKSYDIRAYLGVPVMANNTVVGSLCVLDTQARHFSSKQRATLEQLAMRVNARLAELAARRTVRASRAADLAARAVTPALDELRAALSPIPGAVGAGRMAAAAIANFLRLAEHTANGGNAPEAAIRKGLAAARAALDDALSLFDEIDVASADADETAAALRDVLSSRLGTALLSEVALAGRELARRDVTAVGGAFFPEVTEDHPLAAPRALAVALVANALSALAARLAGSAAAAAGSARGIQMSSRADAESAYLVMTAAGLSEQHYREIAEDLTLYVAGDTLITAASDEAALTLGFALPRESPGG